MATRPLTSRTTDLKKCLQIGVSFGVAFSVWATLQYVVRGPSAFAKYGIPFGAIVSFHLVGGVTAGAVVGLLLRLATTGVGAFVVGVFACVPLAVALRFMLAGAKPWSPADTAFCVVWPLLLGGTSGLMLRQIFGAPDSR